MLKNKNENTARSANTWVNRFENWRIARGLPLPLLEIRHEDLDETLQLFYSNLVKADGQPYEPTSLRTMLAGLDRFFRDNGKTFSIQNDKEFKRSHKVLNGKAIELRELGKGKKTRRAHALTQQEEELLWEKVFGCHTAESLNYTVYYTVSQQFGTRGCQEHHQIRIEDLKWVRDPDTGCTIYTEWTEGITKTRKGGLQKAERTLKQRMFATGGPRCPVGIMEAMIAKRPDELKSTGPLYLRPLPQPKGAVWYTKQPVGVNTINRYMKDIAEKAGLGDSGKNITNHSTRKTLVKKLKKAGVDGRNIAAITGHKTEERL